LKSARTKTFLPCTSAALKLSIDFLATEVISF
jgi:hypothetical protein